MKVQLEVHGEGTSRLPRIRTMLDYGGNDPGVKVCCARMSDASGYLCGTTLGWYRVGALIGRGGMGKVYRAEDVGLHRAVALKVRPEARHRSLARFVQEARAASTLNNVDAVTAGGESGSHGPWLSGTRAATDPSIGLHFSAGQPQARPGMLLATRIAANDPEEMMMTRFVTACAMVAALGLTAVAQTTGTANMDILRQKLKADKKLVVAENLALTEAEGTKFWPVYDAYQKDLQQVNQRIVALVMAYADAYNKGAVTDPVAKKLLDEALAVDDAEVKLKGSYVPKIIAALPATKAARYLQIENKIRAAIRYEMAEGIPLVK